MPRIAPNSLFAPDHGHGRKHNRCFRGINADIPSMNLDAALLRIFAATRYRVLGCAPPLALQVGQYDERTCMYWPEARSFALITAYNPGGTLASDAENLDRQRQLQVRLNAAKLERHPTLASAADGSYAEPGWLLRDPDLAWLDDTARLFGQLATLAWPAGQPVRLRCYGTNPGLTAAQCACMDFIE